MSNDEKYYCARANAERKLALSSERQDVAAIHQELAQLYQALIEQAELRPALRIATPERMTA